MPKLPTSSAESELASFAAVSSLLWNERELLERVLYKLTVQRLVLASGSTRWLNQANAEVAAAISQVSGSDILRAAEIEALTETLNLPHQTTLSELCAIAPEPWNELLSDHRAALRSLVAEIDALGADVRRLLKAGMTAIRETLDSLGPAVSGYDASGSSVSHGAGPLLLDEQA
jgi:hypothetical protein